MSSKELIELYHIIVSQYKKHILDKYSLERLF